MVRVMHKRWFGKLTMTVGRAEFHTESSITLQIVIKDKHHQPLLHHNRHVERKQHEARGLLKSRHLLSIGLPFKQKVQQLFRRQTACLFPTKQIGFLFAGLFLH